MPNPVRHIVIVALAMGLLSMLYFLALVLHLPPVLVPVLIIISELFFIRYLIRVIPTEDPSGFKDKWWLYLVFVLGIGLFVYNAYFVDEKYGGWDAWCMWSLHAGFLSGGADKWWKMFLASFAEHTDYPLLLPGINGFFMRYMHLYAWPFVTYITYVTSISFGLAIPVLLFLVNVRRNTIIGMIVFFVFVTNTFYVSSSVSQYADLPLAFYFLCALITIDQAKDNKVWLMISAASIGCCMWTKNEGVILAALFIAFNSRQFFSKQGIKWFLMGIFLPCLVLMIFKVGYAPANDLVGSLNFGTFKQLLMSKRYSMIGDHFWLYLNEHFLYAVIGFIAYLVLCIIERKGPSRHFYMLIACMVVYLFIYVLSTQDLEWHLATSQERLMIQLMPAMLYVVTTRFSTINKDSLVGVFRRKV